jgi:hypothetical protein
MTIFLVRMISSLVDKFKGLWYGESKAEVEGYMIMSDTTNNRTLLMVKDSEKSWKTKWYDNGNNSYKSPDKPLNAIFNTSK